MSRKLVAYFSAGGVTARAAKTLAEAAGADLYEIRPAVPYTGADLDWTNQEEPQQRGDERSVLPSAHGGQFSGYCGTRCDLCGLPRLVVYGAHDHQDVSGSLRFWRESDRSLRNIRRQRTWKDRKDPAGSRSHGRSKRRKASERKSGRRRAEKVGGQLLKMESWNRSEFI